MEELKDFCRETSIHGLGQIANTRASGVTRLLWLGLFLVSLLYAGQQLTSSIRSKLKYFEVTYSGLFSHKKSQIPFYKFELCLILVWIEEPVIDVLDSTSFPIEKVEFPTITICQKSSNSERWGPFIKVFDHMNVVCPET